MGGEGEWEEVAEEPQEEYEEGYEEAPAEAESEYEEEEPGERPQEPARAVARPDKSVLAMLSGLGFFVAVLLLIFGVWNLSAAVPAGAAAFTGLTIVGLFLAILAVVVVAVTQASVALFLYSMLWQE